MDNLRGPLGRNGDGHDPADDDFGPDLPPAIVAQDERRMQVRAYNFWASLLDNRTFPPVSRLDTGSLADFGPFSVLLDFANGIEDPEIRFVGTRLAEECGNTGPIRTLADVPSRSLLSRITDHYMQILANQAPIGFEAEFVNQRGTTILYRGILLPFSSDDITIDTILGVINWKELADQQTTDELLLEIDQVLDLPPDGDSRGSRPASPFAAWADGPADTAILELVTPLDDDAGLPWPTPAFGHNSGYNTPAVPQEVPLPAALLPELDLGDFDDLAADDDAGFAPLMNADVADDMGLADWLDSARQLAQAALGTEDRSRQALYAAVSRAYDFSLAAAEDPAEFRELLIESGLTMQDRAPMTPVVKLVFGATYDKTRLTEYATVLAHAHRLGLPRGGLAAFLAEAPGGLKGVVGTERRLKREEAGDEDGRREGPRAALARRLRTMTPVSLADMPSQGAEFTLLVARRTATGELAVLGEVGDDAALVERAARHLIGG